MRRMILMLTLVLVLALASCGPRVADIEADMSDFEFNPDSWEVPAGATVNLTLNNIGTQDHEWVLMVLGAEATIPFDEDDEPNVFWEGEAEPGETMTFTFTAPEEPGEYQIVCGEPAHMEQGMIGTLFVTR